VGVEQRFQLRQPAGRDQFGGNAGGVQGRQPGGHGLPLRFGLNEQQAANAPVAHRATQFRFQLLKAGVAGCYQRQAVG